MPAEGCSKKAPTACRPHLDALGDRNGLRQAGDHDSGSGLGREVCKLRVVGEEQQVRFNRQAATNLIVGDPAKPEGDDVFSVVARRLEAPVELDGEILVEENPHQVSGDLLDCWWQVSGNMSRVTDGGENLVTGQVVRLLNGLNSVACADRPDNGGDIDAGTGKARLAESDARVHRDPWVDLRCAHLLRPVHSW